MTELSDLWAQYQEIEQTGDTTSPTAKKIEDRIHEIQKGMGTSRYDFDKRRLRHRNMGAPTIEIPQYQNKPDTDEVNVPQANFTYEQARALISDNDFALLEDCAKDYEIKAVVVGRILEGLNPENKTNHARRGQGINWTIDKFNKDKEKNNG